jgi:hypothetical protein
VLEPPIITNDKQVEKFKMLSETKEHLLDLGKFILNELINILQKILMIHQLMLIKQVLAPT